jgi:hypothetical protein
MVQKVTFIMAGKEYGQKVNFSMSGKGSCIKVHATLQHATCNFSTFFKGQNGILTAWGWLTDPMLGVSDD